MSDKFLRSEKNSLDNEILDTLEKLNNNTEKLNDIDASLGVKGQFPVIRYGFNDGVGGVNRLLTQGPFNGVYCETFPRLFLNNLQITSDSANDTIAGGTGAQIIQIIGIDIGFNEITEFIVMTGLTPVNTVNQFRFINYASVLQTGTGETNSGNIFISPVGTALTGGVPNNSLYHTIVSEIGFSQVPNYMIPVNCGFQIKNFTVNSDANTNKPLNVYIYLDFYDQLNNKYTVSNPNRLILIQGLVNYNTKISYVLPPLSIIRIHAFGSGSPQAFCSFEGIKYDLKEYPDVIFPR